MQFSGRSSGDMNDETVCDEKFLSIYSVIIIVNNHKKCSLVHHKVLSVLVQGDAGVHGRSGLPGRKGEQVWLMSSRVILPHRGVCVCVSVSA